MKKGYLFPLCSSLHTLANYWSQSVLAVVLSGLLLVLLTRVFFPLPSQAALPPDYDIGVPSSLEPMEQHTRSASVSGQVTHTVHLPFVARNFRKPVVIGIDLDASDNTTTSLGNIGTCASIYNIGEQIALDVYVQKITDLDAYRFRIGYDPAVLQVTAVDTDFLLFSNAGGVPSDTIDLLPDADGSLIIQSSDASTDDGESGSGVLARITFQATAEGSSDITFIKTITAPATPALFDANGAAISDTDGDTRFDDHIFLGRIQVGGECAQLPNLVVVGFHPGTDEATMNSIIGDRGLKIVQREDDRFILRVVSGVTVDDVVGSLLTALDVEFAEPVFLHEMEDWQTHPNDPEYNSPRAHQWNLVNVGQEIYTWDGLIDADQDAPQAWDLITDCRGLDPANPIVIAVIDTGAEVTHPDLDGNIWVNPGETPGDHIDNDGNGVIDDVNGAFFDYWPPGVMISRGDVTDLRGHGTAVASVIAAEGNNGRELAGVCWSASILIVKTDLTSVSLVRAMQYILDLKAAGVDIRLVNASYGGGWLSSYERAWIAKLGEADILFIAAAGNESRSVAAPVEDLYQDINIPERVSNGDLRLTDVVAGDHYYAAGSVVRCPGDADCGAVLAAMDARDTYHDANNNGAYEQGEAIYWDDDQDHKVSGRYDDTNRELGAPAGSCKDGVDNDDDKFEDEWDVDCHDADRRKTMVSAAHPLWGSVQYDSGSRVRCHVPAMMDPRSRDADCGEDLKNFPDNVRYVVGDWNGRLAYPCSYDLDNIICVGATDNRDHLTNFTNVGSPMVDLFAPGENIRVLDVIGTNGAEIYRTAAPTGTAVTAGGTRLVEIISGNRLYAPGSVVGGGDNDVGSPLRSYPADVKHLENVTANGQYDAGEHLYRDDDGNGQVSTGDIRLNPIQQGGKNYPSGSIVECHVSNDTDCGSALIAFAATEKYNSTRFIDGTSFSAPNTTGMAALCWSLMPDRTPEEIKALLLRFVDRKPQFEGFSLSGGRLRWACGYELGDAPSSYQTISREASANELLRCASGDNGPIHLDYGNEILGEDASQEHNANTPRPLDMDPNANLGPGDPGTCPSDQDDLDLYDDGDFVFTPLPPWTPGQTVSVTFKVCSALLDGAGNQIGDFVGGRYDSGNPDKRVYVTAWFDWDRGGDFTGEYTPLSPGEVIHEIDRLLPFASPVVPPPTGCVTVTRTFTALGNIPSWYRFRLDYGEHKGDNDPKPLFRRDPNVPVTDERQIASFGEVEDYFLGDEFGDADPQYPTRLTDNGAHHMDTAHEWFGQFDKGHDESVSEEYDAEDPRDVDGTPNLRNDGYDLDRFDDGVLFYPLTYRPNEQGKLEFIVCVDEVGDRYDPNDPDKSLYVNAWIDWDTDWTWEEDNEEHIIDGLRLAPKDASSWAPLSLRNAPTATVTLIFTSTNCARYWAGFEVGATIPFTYPRFIGTKKLWARFRLDYGEDVGRNDPRSLFRSDDSLRDPSLSLTQTQPAGQGIGYTQGAARFGEVEDYLIGSDFGDAPDPYTAPGHYPTRKDSFGARHLDINREWLGPSGVYASATRETDGCDLTLAERDRVPNLGDDCDDSDRDVKDDGAKVPFVAQPGERIIVEIDVSAQVDSRGFANRGPGGEDSKGISTLTETCTLVSIPDMPDTPVQHRDRGRYSAWDPQKRLYLNVWADWDGNGVWEAGELVISGPLDPEVWGGDGRYTLGEPFTDQDSSGVWNLGEPYTDTAGISQRHLQCPVDVPLDVAQKTFWWRFRLDYGENASTNDAVIHHVTEDFRLLTNPRGGALWGEVEDYPMSIVTEPVKISTPNTVIPGDTIQYTVTLPANPELEEPAEAWIEDALPELVQFVGDSLTCTTGECQYNEGEHTVTWAGELEPQEVVVTEFEVTVPKETPPPYPPYIVNRAETFDGILTRIRTTTTTLTPPLCTPLTGVTIEGGDTVTVGEDLELSSKCEPEEACGDETIDYEWSVINLVDGQGMPTATYRYDEVGEYTVVLTATNCGGEATVTDTHEVTVTPSPCTPLTGVVIAGEGTVAIGEELALLSSYQPADADLPITYKWSTDGLSSDQGAAAAVYSWAEAGKYTVVLTATNCGGEAMVTDTHEVTVTPIADLSVSKSDSPDPVLAGNPLTYTIVVTNKGPSLATNVILTDTLPDGVVFRSATPSRGSCSGTETIECELVELELAVPWGITVIVTPTTAEASANAVEVAADEPDPDPSNNTGTESTSVCPIIVDLGTLGGTESKAYDVNDAGQIVGRSNVSGDAVYHAFLWENGVMVDLGTLAGDTNSSAFGINQIGQAVGDSCTAAVEDHAFLWSKDEGMVGLGGFTEDSESVANGINDAGQVVGWSDTVNWWVFRAFLWTDTEGMTNLGTLSGGTNSEARDINSAEMVVGWSDGADLRPYATLWDEGDITNLGTLTGCTDSEANAINDSGQVVGASYTGEWTPHAFFWSADDGMTDLGEGWIAYDINDNGQVIGSQGVETSTAVLWEDGALIDLNNLLPPDSDWVLQDARGINDNGGIVGWGEINDEVHAFYLALTEEACLPADSYPGATIRSIPYHWDVTERIATLRRSHLSLPGLPLLPW